MYKSFYGGIETKILLEDIQPDFDTTSEMFEEKTFFYPHYLAGMSMSKMRHDICIKIMTRIMHLLIMKPKICKHEFIQKYMESY
ncbi:hypothetical protein LUA10_20065 (plasmid) [Proteus mirabilis]|uniref:hypothetical protein n=1 Tax=Proteus mirabilis TaxID=584 RepID=UPI001E3DCF0A|nr:hypothetical protein [Proteus mirabilis]UHD51761.1 hypothetical protein LUA10_20065 [Proteus mirabilis]